MIKKWSWFCLCAGMPLVLYASVDKTALEDKDKLAYVAIIGGGAAGYAAAIPAARAGYQPIIFQGPKPGGELMDSAIIENWPGLPKDSGALMMHKLEKQAVQFGALLDPATVIDIDFSSWPYKLTTNTGQTVHALTVIIATGASQKKLGIENEDVYYGNGLFSCGICDAFFTKNRDAVIIGGGDIAIQRALQIAPKAKTITLITDKEHLTANESMKQKLKCIKHASVLAHKKVTKIVGDGEKIDHVELVDPITQEPSTFKTQAIFLSTGLTANSDLFKGKLELDSDGCIKLKDDRSQETPIEGVMACGTVADPLYRQVATVIGDATKASLDALRALSKKGIDDAQKEGILARLYKPTPLAHIKSIRSVSEFSKIIKKEVDPVLVEFYSPLCHHCKNMEPRLSTVSEKYKNFLKVYKVNRDKLAKLIEMHGVKMIPAFLIFINGQEQNRIEGEIPEDVLFNFVEETCKFNAKKGLCHPLSPF